MNVRKFFEILLGFDKAEPPPATDLQRWQNTLLVGAKLRQNGDYESALQVFERVLAETRQAVNPVAEATALGHIGATYTDQQKWSEAKSVLQQAGDIAGGQDSVVLQAAVLNDLAKLMAAMGDDAAAQAGFEAALDYARQGDDPNLVAHILAELAAIYMRESNASYAQRLLEEANELTHSRNPTFVGNLGLATTANGNALSGQVLTIQALRLAQVLGDEAQEVKWAYALAQSYQDAGQLHEAERQYQRVSSHLSRHDHLSPAERIDFLSDRADIAVRIGQYAHAVRYALEALPLAEEALLPQQEAADVSQVVRLHSLLGSAYRVVGQPAEAAEHLETALASLTADTPPDERITLQLELGLVQQMTDTATAQASFTEAAELAREINAQEQLAQALTYLGRLAHSQADNDTALGIWREALGIYEALGDYRHQATLQCDVANILRDRGERKQALRFYEQALVTLNNVKHAATRGLVLSNVANVYTDTGDVETAQAFFEESITIARQAKDGPAESLRLGNLGWFFIVTGQPQQAVQRLEQALVISERLDNPLMVAVQCDNLGLAYARLGNFAQAVEQHNRALQRIEGLDQPRWAGTFNSNLGETYARQGQYDDAQRKYLIALDLSKTANDEAMMARTLWRMGDLQREVGELADAKTSYDRAVQLARLHSAQRDLALAVLGQGLLAQVQQQAEQAGKLLQEARRQLAILHAPELRLAENALNQEA